MNMHYLCPGIFRNLVCVCVFFPVLNYITYSIVTNVIIIFIACRQLPSRVCVLQSDSILTQLVLN